MRITVRIDSIIFIESKGPVKQVILLKPKYIMNVDLTYSLSLILSTSSTQICTATNLHSITKNLLLSCGFKAVATSEMPVAFLKC